LPVAEPGGALWACLVFQTGRQTGHRAGRVLDCLGKLD